MQESENSGIVAYRTRLRPIRSASLPSGTARAMEPTAAAVAMAPSTTASAPLTSWAYTDENANTMPTGSCPIAAIDEPALEVPALAAGPRRGRGTPLDRSRARPTAARESWVRMNTKDATVMAKAITKSGRIAPASTCPDETTITRAEDGADDPEQPRRDRLADRHAGRPVLVRQAVAADGRAAVAADRSSRASRPSSPGS